MRPKRAVLLTLCSRNARRYRETLDLARQMRTEGDMGPGTIGLHFATPAVERDSLRPAANDPWQELRAALRDGEFPLITMGWAGAPWHLLTPEEMEWELTWSLTNHWDSGARQLWRAEPVAVMPRACTPAQMRSAAARLGLPILAGTPFLGACIPPQPTLPTEAAHYRVQHPATDSCGDVPVRSFSEVPPEGTDREAERYELVHLVVRDPAQFSQTGWPRQLRLWNRHSDWVGFERLLSSAAPTDSSEAVIRAVSAMIEPMPRSDVATYHRRRAAVQRERVCSVLGAVGLDAPPSPPAAPTTVPPLRTNSSGSAAGAVTLNESGLVALFLGARLAELKVRTTDLNRPDQRLLPLHRTQSYVRGGPGGGAVSYGETTGAAWFETDTVRGVFEQTRLSTGSGSAISSTVTSMVVAGLPVLYQLIEVYVPADLSLAPTAHWTPLRITLNKGASKDVCPTVRGVSGGAQAASGTMEVLFNDHRRAAVVSGELLWVKTGEAALCVGAWSGAGPLIWPFTLCRSTVEAGSELHLFPAGVANAELSAAMAGRRFTLVLSWSAVEPPRELPREIALRAAAATFVFD